MNYYKEIKNQLINNEIYKKAKNYSKNKNDLETYYNVGKLLIEAQGGEERAKYGEEIIKEYEHLCGIYKVEDIIIRLREYGIEPLIVDPWASARDAMHEYGVTLTALEDVDDADCVIVAVADNEFKALSLQDIKKLFKNCQCCQ